MTLLIDKNRCAFLLPGFMLLLGMLGISWSYPSMPDDSFSSDLPTDKTIKTEVGLSPEALVRNVFAGGVCDNITNIVGLGHADGLGYFENGKAAIGLDRGIIISSGPIVYAANANSTGDKSGDFGDKSGDPDLETLASASVRDRVGLEFDFVPLDSFVTFRYVFASEEYCEFVGSKYNDVFGFFVSGAGIEGGFTGNAKNVALIPGTQDLVSINNVNHKKNQQYYIDNTRKKDAERCGVAYVASEQENFIEYDGFTVTLTATLKLSPCESYHIRLVVADVADNFYDSAVFLEAGSFDLGGQVSVSAVQPMDQPISEGCNNAYFQFSRDQNQSDEFPLNIRFRLEESSTAISGLDFAALPRTVRIPAGQRSVKLPVEIYNDELIEGEETIAVVLDIPCACYSDGAELIISEPPDLILNLEDRYICPDQSIYLEPVVSGGNGPYTYHWSDGSEEDRLLVSQVHNEPYSLTLTDACGQERSVSARVMPSTPPTAFISGAEEICQGDTTLLEINFTGAAPWSFSYSLDGGSMPSVEDVTTNPYYLSASLDGDYQLTRFSDAGCTGTTDGLASISVREILVSAESESVSCAGGEDGRIKVTIPEDFPPYTYFWDHTPEEETLLEGVKAGTYTFHVIDGQGCSSALSVAVNEPEPLRFPEIDCEQIREGSWIPLATGGTSPYTYQVDQKELDSSNLMDELVVGESYSMLIEDANGCSILDTFLVPLLGMKAVELPPKIILILGKEYQFTPELHLPESLLAGIRWLPGENLSCDDCLNPSLIELKGGSYSINTIDKFGCTDEAETEIILNTDYPIYVPNAFSPNGDDNNDRFGLMSHNAVVSQLKSMTIYNRWGNRLFQVADLPAFDHNASWDGTVSGKAAPPGIYVYHMEVELTNGDRQVLMGDVLLVR